VDIRTLARNRTIYQGLTPAQLAQLAAIVEHDDQPLFRPICETLVDVGLIRRDGDRYVPTEDGRYIASLR
jgi:hypothetical protein